MLPLAFLSSPSRSYERLGYRLQALIASPHVQKRQYVDVKPAPEESEADWARLLDALEETNGVRVEHLQPGLIRIAWREFTEIT